jgi:methionyl-tRNA formyltransferase
MSNVSRDALRIVYAGSPDFAVPALQALLAANGADAIDVDIDVDVIAVLTQPDRPSGRGRKLQAGPVKAAALAAGIEVLQPLTLKDAEVQQQLRDLQADLFIVVAYGLLLPPEVLQLPRLGCINVHASLLPRWRGASPMQSAILAGDSETGVCIMQMDVGLDTGPVFSRASLEIGANETAAELHDRLAALGGGLLVTALPGIASGELQAEPQPAAGATHAAKIKKADGVIDWNASAVVIHRAVCAYNAWPVAQTTLAGEQLRIWQAQVVETDVAVNIDATVPGTVLACTDAGIAVQTGDGQLLLTEVQAPGRKRISAREFAQSRDLTNNVLGQ